MPCWAVHYRGADSRTYYFQTYGSVAEALACAHWLLQRGKQHTTIRAFIA
jgi:hypothetical protein